MSETAELVKVWKHLTPKQQAFVVSMAAKRGYKPTGGSIFSKLWKKVIKPVGKVAAPIVGAIAVRAAEKAITKRLGGSARVGGCGACKKPRKRKPAGQGLRLAGRGVSQF